jgi:NADH-quinone oxidoreductase subunit M
MSGNALLLNVTWMLPLATALGLAFLPNDKPTPIRRWSAWAAFANLLVVAYLTRAFFIEAPVTPEGSTRSVLTFVTQMTWLPSLKAEFFVGVDAISMFLMLLAAMIVFAGTLASFRIEYRVKTFFILLQVLASGTFGSFIAFDLLLFFFFSELTLVPTFLLIALFGSGRREFAAMKLVLLLMFGSALVLLGILGLVSQPGAGTFNLLSLSQLRFDTTFQFWAYPVLFLGFALLGNLFPLHIWSPDGHAAAPTAVSMFLAGVHMKIGAYGCLRIAHYLLPEGAAAWALPFAILAATGALWGGFAALRQTDLKYWNAYSSVSHCALVFLGLCALNADGMRGAVFQMLSHGFITATVFCVIGFIYERTHTRAFSDMGGLMKVMPFLGICFVLGGFASLGLPGLSGFAAELPIFLGGFTSKVPGLPWVTGISLFALVLAAIYVLRGVNQILHGTLKSPFLSLDESNEARDVGDARDAIGVTWRERLALLVLLIAVFALGLYPQPWAERIDQALQPIMNQIQKTGEQG